MQRVGVGRGVVLVLAAGTALVGLRRQPLWFDEVATSRASSLPWAGLGRLLGSTDANIGAYYALLHLWRVFGDGPVALRLPSALAAVATVVVTERVGRRLLGPAPALLGAALLAVHPFTTAYARDARPYALVTLACTTALLLELRAREDPRRRRLAACAVVAALAVLLHLYAVLPLTAYGLALLPAGRRDRRRRLQAHLAVVPVVGAVLAVSLHQQAQLAWVPGLSVSRVVTGLALLAGGALPLVAVAAALVWAARGGLPEPARRVLLCGVALPVGGLVAASLLAPTFVPRYLAPTVPLQCLLLAAGGWALWRQVASGWLDRAGLGRRAAAGVLTGAVVTWLAVGTGVGLAAPYRYEDYRAAARTLLTQEQPGDGVVFGQQGARLGLEYYLARLARPGSPAPRDVLAAAAGPVGGFTVPEVSRAAVPRALAPYRRLWVAWHRDTPRRLLGDLSGFACTPRGRYGLLELDLCRAGPVRARTRGGPGQGGRTVVRPP